MSKPPKPNTKADYGRHNGKLRGVDNGNPNRDAPIRQRQNMNLPDRSKPKIMDMLTMNDVDGRTVAYRQMKSAVEEMSSDLGGSDSLSRAQKELMKRAAVLGAMLEALEAGWMNGGEMHLAEYLPILNAQGKLLNQLGLKRVAKEVTHNLSSYLKAKDKKK